MARYNLIVQKITSHSGKDLPRFSIQLLPKRMKGTGISGLFHFAQFLTLSAIDSQGVL